MKILITDDFYLPILDEFPKDCNVDFKPKITYEELKEEIKNYDVLIISTRIKITKELLENSKNLKFIIRLGIGVDHIDLTECKKRKILVSNTPNSNVGSVVELVFGQIIREYRKLEIAHENLFNGNFRKGYPQGKELKNKTIGIIGVGRIGSAIANIAQAFGMKTIGFDPYLSLKKRKKAKIDLWLPISELLKNSDIVTLHVPSTEETRYLVNSDFLSLMKKDSILINCSRGKVVNFKEVVDFSKKHIISKFIFDVFEEEPVRLSLEEDIARRFFFSPHIGALTEESLYNRSKEALELLCEFLEEKKIHGKINYKKGY